MAHVSVMVYYTPDFSTYLSNPDRNTKHTRNHWRDPVRHIESQIAYANHVFHENDLPVELKLHNIEYLEGFVENENSNYYERLIEFGTAKESVEDLLKEADVAILMTGTPANGQRTLGAAGKCNHHPIAWVLPHNDLTLIHEVGHIFGCNHNATGPEDKSNYATLVRTSNGQLTNMSTIMYDTSQEEQYQHYSGRALSEDPNLEWLNNQKIPYFSSKDLTHLGFRLGDDQHDNRGQIMKTRVAIQ